MLVHFTVNGTDHSLDVHAGELLRTALRRLRYYSVKFGDEHALTGADAVLLTMTPDRPRSYRLVNSGSMLVRKIQPCGRGKSRSMISKSNASLGILFIFIECYNLTFSSKCL